MLGLRRELADHHVFDHALPQRAYGLIGHGGCSCLDEGCEPFISRQDAPPRYRVACVGRRGALPRERFSPLAQSGRSANRQKLANSATAIATVRECLTFLATNPLHHLPICGSRYYTSPI